MTQDPTPDLSHVACWIFDLDNTLYHPRVDLFAQIDVRMGRYIQDLLGVDAAAARTIQKRFFHEHGTTLRGLMDRHGIEPRHFLDYVHAIDLTVLDPAPRLARALERLPGRKLIFTNADGAYAERVLDRLGLTHCFDGLHDIIGADFAPKPDASAYDRLVARHGVDPRRALFVEDMARNLAPAKALGMTTVWVDCASERGDDGAGDGHVDLVIADVADWLTGLTAPPLTRPDPAP